MQVGPFLLEFAVAIEHLNAAVLTVGHEHPVVACHPDAVRQVELARRGAGAAPRRFDDARHGEPVAPRRPIAVGHEHRAVGGHVGVGGMVESVEARRLARGRIAAHVVVVVGGPDVKQPDLAQHLARRVAHPHDLGEAIREPELLVVVDEGPMRMADKAVTPVVDQRALAVEHQHGMRAAPEAVDAAAAVRHHAADPARCDVGRNLGPARNEIEGESTAACAHDGPLTITA